MFEPLKLFTVALALLLLAPFGLVFFHIAAHQSRPEVLRRIELEAALRENASRVGETNEDGSTVAVVGVRAVELIGFSERTLSWLSFYPRRWVGIVGLIAVAAILVCLVIALFVPQTGHLSLPP